MEWMRKWLELPFYESGQRCKRHSTQYNTIYCSTCMERLVCEICWRKKCLSKLHQGNGHRVLKVVRASKRPAIKIAEAVKLMDASGVQVYRINGDNIYHLHPGVGSDASAIDESCCVTCLRPLTKPGYEYCSIACKFEKEGRNMEIKSESGSSSPSSDIDFEMGEIFVASPPSTSTADAPSTSTAIELPNPSTSAPSTSTAIELPNPKRASAPSTSTAIELPNPKRASAPSTSTAIELPSPKSTLRIKIKMAKNPMNGSDQCSGSGFVSLRKRSRKGIPRRAPFQ